MSLDYVDKELPRLLAQHTPALGTKCFNDRRAACEAATAAVRKAREHDRELRQQEDARAGEKADATIAALERTAEDFRLACAKVLLDEAFDTSNPNSLASLIPPWRSEPSRQLTLAIRERWDDLDRRAQVELYQGLSPTVLIQIFVDLVIDGMPGTPLAHLCQVDYGCSTGPTGPGQAVYDFSRAGDPATMQHALERLESALLTAARRGADMPDEPRFAAQHALRRQHATGSDLTKATNVFGVELERKRQEEFARTYVPPSREPPLRPHSSAADSGGLLGVARHWLGT